MRQVQLARWLALLWTVSALLGLDSACLVEADGPVARRCQAGEQRQQTPTAFRAGEGGERLPADRTSKDQESVVESAVSSKLAGIPASASSALHRFGRTSSSQAHFLSLSMRWQV